MSDIPKSKRAWSKLEALDKAITIRGELSRELLISFGLSEKHIDAAVKKATKGLIVNVKKTRITKISKPFRHLQVSYRLTETGRIERRINPKAITRERRKLKAYKRLLEAGRLEYPAIENAFKSWLGGHYKYMTHGQIYQLASLFYELFGRRPTWRKGHSRLFWMMTHRLRASSSTGTAL